VEPDQQRETRRARSAALFGNRYIAEVVAAVEVLAPPRENVVTTRMVASKTKLSDSLVRPVILRLEAAGLLAREERSGGPRSELRFQVRDEALWPAIARACAILRAQGGEQAGEDCPAVN
jgi:ribosomal protein S25